MEILNPIPSAPVASWSSLAPRPRDLRGKRIGVLDNSKPNADALLGRVAELLVERAGAAEIRHWRKPGASIPAADHDALAAGADAFLAAPADWGSSSSWSLRSTPQLERRSGPTVLLVPEPFRSLATTAAAAAGMPH